MKLSLELTLSELGQEQPFMYFDRTADSKSIADVHTVASILNPINRSTVEPLLERQARSYGYSNFENHCLLLGRPNRILP